MSDPTQSTPRPSVAQRISDHPATDPALWIIGILLFVVGIASLGYEQVTSTRESREPHSIWIHVGIGAGFLGLILIPPVVRALASGLGSLGPAVGSFANAIRKGGS